MDIKAIIDDIVKKIGGNEELLAKFKSDPIPVIESVLKIDLPDEAIKSVIGGVMDKISGAEDIGDKITDKLEGIVGEGKLGDLLDKAKDILG
ncbi:MAG: hypothetical protein IJC18_05595 [Clostridia bacterium]|nr:hypothetical protein [Clostridia bacterium]MBQ9993777.1 hypothetical protein [Clostridia bacterium]